MKRLTIRTWLLPILAVIVGILIFLRTDANQSFSLPGTDASISFELECSVPFFCGDLRQTLVVRTQSLEAKKACLNNFSGQYRIQIYRLKASGNFLLVGYDDAAIISTRPVTIKDSTADASVKYPRDSSCLRSMNLDLMYQMRGKDEDQREYLGAYDRRASVRSKPDEPWVFMLPAESPEKTMILNR